MSDRARGSEDAKGNEDVLYFVIARLLQARDALRLAAFGSGTSLEEAARELSGARNAIEAEIRRVCARILTNHGDSRESPESSGPSSAS
ncbi:MAG: hypothetical protein J7M26_03530 [Armatimonadetes bacterium]|nr:hypothetical protein [Armatimonadota bacterium]